MRHIVLAGAAVLLMAGPALAQSTTPPATVPAGCNQHGVPDCGPYTPQANGAYNGGGMVLEGVPGGPAPRATQPLPPMPVSPPQ
jgi:hypothetical protein